MTTTQLYDKIYYGSIEEHNEAAKEIVNRHGGMYDSFGNPNHRAFEGAKNDVMDIYNNTHTSLRAIILKASKYNIHVAAGMLQKMHTTGSYIDTLLMGREPVFDNFLKIAKLLFEAE